VVVVAARGQEEHLGHLEDHIEAQDVDVEGADLGEVACAHVHVADGGALGDRPRGALAGDDGALEGG